MKRNFLDYKLQKKPILCNKLREALLSDLEHHKKEPPPRSQKPIADPKTTICSAHKGTTTLLRLPPTHSTLITPTLITAPTHTPI
jgi:hypothetical protein